MLVQGWSQPLRTPEVSHSHMAPHDYLRLLVAAHGPRQPPTVARSPSGPSCKMIENLIIPGLIFRKFWKIKVHDKISIFLSWLLKIAFSKPFELKRWNFQTKKHHYQSFRNCVKKCNLTSGSGIKHLRTYVSWEEWPCSFIICLIKAVTSKRHKWPKNGRRRKFRKRKRISGIPQVQRTNRFYSATIQTGDKILQSDSPWKIKFWFELWFFKAAQEENSMAASIILHQQVTTGTLKVPYGWVDASPLVGCSQWCQWRHEAKG
jgi:hypothetical protein